MIVLSCILLAGCLLSLVAWVVAGRSAGGDTMPKRGRLTELLARLKLEHRIGRIEGLLHRMDSKLDVLAARQEVLMGFAEDLKANVDALVASVDKAIDLLNQFAAGNVVTPEQASAVLAELQDAKSRLDAAETPPAPPA